MAQPVTFNNKGVTLIEMMISLVIIMIVSLALMQTTLIGISNNQQNILRDEAVSVADMRMNHLRSLTFTNTEVDAGLTAGTTAEAAVSRIIHGFSMVYSPTRQIVDVTNDSKQITITVSWNYKNKNYSHSVTSIMRKQ